MPKNVSMLVRVYNFTDGRTCFNMDIDEKVEESKRKKPIALKLFEEQKYEKALRRFQNIVSFYTEGKINQEGYNEKISALMNSVLCHMKLNQHSEMIPLCDEILKIPKHGTNV